ncbi:MAG: L-aspartate oxidase [uncultured Acidimicrobiales bacterium]|uniref:L-aspartate oxidase n=1 Tax=uncultured Acidimicrobiales bacterium TaxID=310071 RepID=A0A6J4ICQ0_9ACTN|nr:MAG: L-aspartate oxidase [uncultured Acidimicrobiales bacterium]
MPAPDLDLLVVGSGVAGLSAAVRAAGGPGLRVGLLTKGELTQAATRWAQGGVAAVLGGDEDSTDLHLADTLKAGAGLCDVDAVRVLVDEGAGRVSDLIALGAMFDVDHEGRLLKAREGGHSMPRIVHAGGAATGAEIERALVAAVRETAASVLEGWLALDLLVEGGRCRGVRATAPDGVVRDVRAANVLMATGGAGQLFAVTTNPKESTGDGLAMALRAGVAVADVEFMQFHPTALHHPAMPRPLLSEALRGHGALLRDAKGERFVDELQPRDVVARAMTATMLEQGVEHLWLDATHLESFDARFPTIANSVQEIGLDPSRDWLPIAPAAHHLSGGIVTDLDGATTLPGLWAACEVACTGVHGANRLASNSLLEGMVFAPRVVEAIERGKEGPEATGAMRDVLHDTAPRISAARNDDADGRHATTGAGSEGRERLQRAMTEGAGVLRSAESLARTRDVVAGVETGDDVELANLVQVAFALLASATAREESRGSHTRTDFPATSDSFKRRLVIS